MTITNLSHCNEECYFGADFGGSSIRLLQLEKKGDGFDVVGWSQKKIPKGVIDQGKIIKKDDFINIFQEAMENVEGEFSSSNVMLTIPEETVFTRVISVPIIENKKELEETIKWETEATIPVAISDIYYDWQVLDKSEDKINILVMATDKDVVDNYLDIFDSLHLKVVALEPESLSMARSLIAQDSEDYTLLIDLGSRSSNFAVCKKNLPIFTANSSISGRMLTDIIIKELGLSFEKAERYKIKRGIEDNKIDGINRSAIFSPVLDTLVQEIKKTIEFLEENLSLKEQKKKVTKIVLCGGGSNLKGLGSYLTVKLKQPVALSNPWVNLSFVKKIPPISKENSQGFAPVIGLTLKSQDYVDVN